ERDESWSGRPATRRDTRICAVFASFGRVGARSDYLGEIMAITMISPGAAYAPSVSASISCW
ncbi:MAG: hypothetical protein KY456_10450, partial [Chloroflexi bacterium]|nr:hypothetical protein [Chloroflexota bacterium]